MRQSSSENPSNHFLTVAAVVLAGVIQVSTQSGPFTFWNVIIGAVLLVILWSYELPTTITSRERLVLAATWGFTLLTTLGLMFQEIYRLAPAFVAGIPFLGDSDEAPGFYYFIIWLVLSFISYSRFAQPSQPSQSARPAAAEPTIQERTRPK